MAHGTTGYKIMLMLALRHRKARQAVKASGPTAPLWVQDMNLSQMFAAKEIHQAAKELYAKKAA